MSTGAMNVSNWRCRIALQLCTCVVAAFHGTATLQAQTVTQIRDSGPRSNRINVVILSEGYTSSELPKFQADAQRVMTGLLESEPYREYRNYFNAFTIAVASRESGSDHPSRGIVRDTYFNSSYDTYGVDRMLTIPPNPFIGDYAQGQGKIDQLLMQFVPDFDMVLLLVNDQQSGGTGGGRTAIISMAPEAIGIAVHETGHTFADLADEYDTPTPGTLAAERPNVTQQTVRERIRWSSWILPSTPIPTPETHDRFNTPHYGNVVGLFEGAAYNPTGWYRPKFTCKMSFSGSPFCEVCRQAVTLTMYRFVSHVDAVTPVTRKVSIELGQSMTFSVTKMQPATHALSVQWYIDDVAVAGATGDSFVVSEANAPQGRHTVRVEVYDGTEFVRDDPQQLLRRSEKWEVAVGPVAPLPPAPVLNLSTRLSVQSGEGVLIGGFIVTGSEPKRVILRALGPSMGGAGILGVSPSGDFPEFLPDPVLELLDSSGGIVRRNDNWRETQEEEIRATMIPPRDPRESAIVTTLAPGAYTAKVAGKIDRPGIALVEVYDLQQSSASQLANISTRGVVQTGDNVMIGGFIIGGSGSGETKIIARALGPSLAAAGVEGTLADPTLELRNRNGELVMANRDWREGQRTEIEATGLQPQDDREAALVATLPAGAYTAIVSGSNAGTGIGLFELYNLGQ